MKNWIKNYKERKKFREQIDNFEFFKIINERTGCVMSEEATKLYEELKELGWPKLTKEVYSFMKNNQKNNLK